MGELVQELKRRNVIRVAIAYAVSAWLLIQVSDTVFPMLPHFDSIREEPEWIELMSELEADIARQRAWYEFAVTT